MLSFLETLYSVVVSHLWALGAAAIAIFTAALVAYWREQARKGTNWILAPLTRALPWNKDGWPLAKQVENLACDFTLIDLYLLDVAGKFARYQKTSRFVVTTDELSSYNEGVTADGFAAEFISMRGTVVETVKEHGFYISHIDLGETVRTGSRFTNTYCADLLNCFSKNKERWSQELALSSNDTHKVTFVTRQLFSARNGNFRAGDCGPKCAVCPRRRPRDTNSYRRSPPMAGKNLEVSAKWWTARLRGGGRSHSRTRLYSQIPC